MEGSRLHCGHKIELPASPPMYYFPAPQVLEIVMVILITCMANTLQHHEQFH